MNLNKLIYYIDNKNRQEVNLNIIEQINLQNSIFIIILILPGFISMRVYSLIRPGEQTTLKDTVFEALAYGMINIGLMSWAIILFAQTPNIFLQVILATLIIAIAPIIWPFLLDKTLEFLASKSIIKYRYKTAWDDFFSRKIACWVIIHMHDSTKIGGLYHNNSYATLFPTPGHIFLEELWEIDQETGEFIGDAAKSHGIILKPEDYRFLEIKDYID